MNPMKLSSFLAIYACALLAPMSNTANAMPGDLDPGFGTGGKVTTDVGSYSNDVGHSVAVQPDGKLVVAGLRDNDFALVRYLPNGALDAGLVPAAK